jgi:hypothetical protein
MVRGGALPCWLGACRHDGMGDRNPFEAAFPQLKRRGECTDASSAPSGAPHKPSPVLPAVSRIGRLVIGSSFVVEGSLRGGSRSSCWRSPTTAASGQSTFGPCRHTLLIDRQSALGGTADSRGLAIRFPREGCHVANMCPTGRSRGRPSGRREGLPGSKVTKLAVPSVGTAPANG